MLCYNICYLTLFWLWISNFTIGTNDLNLYQYVSCIGMSVVTWKMTDLKDEATEKIDRRFNELKI